MAVNLRAVELLSRLAVCHSQQHDGGRIINVASRVAFRGDTPEYIHFPPAIIDHTIRYLLEIVREQLSQITSGRVADIRPQNIGSVAVNQFSHLGIGVVGICLIGRLPYSSARKGWR